MTVYFSSGVRRRREVQRTLGPLECWRLRLFTVIFLFTAPLHTIKYAPKISCLSSLSSLTAENFANSQTDKQSSRTPTPTGEMSGEGEAVETSRRLQKKPSVVSMPGGYRKLDRPVVNLKAIKQLSKWGRRFVYNTLQTEPM